MKLDLTLTFSRSEWVCYNDSIQLKAPTLEAIDDQLELFIQENYPGGNYEVSMYFDFERFPKWHSQYMPHYFNRKLTFIIN